MCVPTRMLRIASEVSTMLLGSDIAEHSNDQNPWMTVIEDDTKGSETKRLKANSCTIQRLLGPVIQSM